MNHERPPKTDEWFTPQYIFDALDVTFDLDVCGSSNNPHQCVPAKRYIDSLSLIQPWEGFIWMNPPFGGRNGIVPWMERFIDHGNGICLTPDRTSAPWWQLMASSASAITFVSPKIHFIDANGNKGKSPSVGTCLFSIGYRGACLLMDADLGFSVFTSKHKKASKPTSGNEA